MLIKLVGGGIAAVITVILLLVFWPFVTVSPGHVGVVITLGRVSDQTLESGFHAVSPLAHVSHVNVQLQRAEAKGEGASKDLQSVHTTLSVNYRVAPAHVARLYQDVGMDFEIKIIDPIVQDRFKSVTAAYTAEELIAKREEIRSKIKSLVVQAVTERSSGGIDVADVLITNFAFSAGFSQAIEQKQVAEQNALKAERDLQRIKVEAEQRIAQAKAEAEAIRIQAQSISAQGGDAYVRLKTVEKWDGKLPQYNLGGATPMLQLK